jgi:hypothetical protein
VNVYRAYVMAKDRRFTSYTTFVCANDEHAIIWAQQLVDGHGVELWSGTRFVIRFNATGEPSAVPRDMTDGPVAPKK